MEQPSVDLILDWLGEIPDPEIPVLSLIDLGVIRDVTWDENTVAVTVTPTYSGCPATSVIEADITTALQDRGIKNIILKRQLSPAWSSDWLSEQGREKLRKYGIAPPNTSAGPQCCPRCNGTLLEKVSQFGSTPCKALWRCQTCLEPFDYFKCI